MATNTRELLTDGIMKVLDIDAAITGDGIVKVLNVDKTLTGDGIVKILDIDATLTSDAIVKEINDATITSDGIVKIRDIDSAVTADGVIGSDLFFETPGKIADVIDDRASSVARPVAKIEIQQTLPVGSTISLLKTNINMVLRLITLDVGDLGGGTLTVKIYDRIGVTVFTQATIAENTKTAVTVSEVPIASPSTIEFSSSGTLTSEAVVTAYLYGT